MPGKSAPHHPFPHTLLSLLLSLLNCGLHKPGPLLACFCLWCLAWNSAGPCNPLPPLSPVLLLVSSGTDGAFSNTEATAVGSLALKENYFLRNKPVVFSQHCLLLGLSVWCPSSTRNFSSQGIVNGRSLVSERLGRPPKAHLERDLSTDLGVTTCCVTLGMSVPLYLSFLAWRWGLPSTTVQTPGASGRAQD